MWMGRKRFLFSVSTLKLTSEFSVVQERLFAANRESNAVELSGILKFFSPPERTSGSKLPADASLYIFPLIVTPVVMQEESKVWVQRSPV
jgi:hypothetical protein